MTMKISDFFRLVKIQHSIFAFPFLLGGLFLTPAYYWLEFAWYKWVALFAAMVLARNAAMGFNRYVDADIDAANPRTAIREIPQGKVTRRAAFFFVLVNSILFVFAAYFLNWFAFIASPLVLLILFFYSYTKRFTWYCHFVLGFGIGLAPSAVWVAITGSLQPSILTLSGALMFYISGFDILYSIQDYDFDRAKNLYSIPSRFGIAKALWFARISHFISFLFFIAVGLLFPLSLLYWMGVIIIGLLMIFEHYLVRPDNLSAIPFAFFNVNSIISFFVGLSIIGGILVQF